MKYEKNLSLIEILWITSLYCEILLPEYNAKALTNHVRSKTVPNMPLTRNIEPYTWVEYEKYTVTITIKIKYSNSLFISNFFFNFGQF